VVGLILLPGNDPLNKKWIEEVSETFKRYFPNRKILYYKHWQPENTKEASINFDLEIQRLKEEISSWQDREYYVFAKSAGCVLALLAMKEGFLKPVQCFFVGFPLYFARQHGYVIEDLLEVSLKSADNNAPVFIQKEFDPACHAENLKEILDGIYPRGYMLNVVKGDNHHYEDIDKLRAYIVKIANPQTEKLRGKF